MWERDPNTLMVEKSNKCPFDTVAVCHGEVDAKFIVLRSTCLTIQNLVKNKSDKRWFAEQGVTPKTLSGPKEVVHHINRFLYREVMTPREKVAKAIEAHKKTIEERLDCTICETAESPASESIIISGEDEISEVKFQFTLTRA